MGKNRLGTIKDGYVRTLENQIEPYKHRQKLRQFLFNVRNRRSTNIVSNNFFAIIIICVKIAASNIRLTFVLREI